MPALYSTLASRAPEKRGIIVDTSPVVQIIRQKFEEGGGTAHIPNLKKRYFTAKLVDGGVDVDNLGSLPFLSWQVFHEAIGLLIRNGGRAKKGNAMNARLGDRGLPSSTIEGYIAQTVYGKRAGEWVFRRITPISCILVWAGVCEAEPNELVLK